MIVTSDFQPAPYLRNAHLQTLFASVVRRPAPLDVDMQRLELPDGDFLDLAWLPDAGQPADTPIVILLHGLTGSLESKYARGLLQRIQALGWRGALMLFRGTGGVPNRLARGYHSGETGDFNHVVGVLRRRFPQAPLAAVGYSLGGNVLLKWLGEQGSASALNCAVAVSVPFDLDLCARAINKGISRAYQRHLLKGMRAAARLKFDHVEPPFKLPDLDQLRDFYAFDDAFTAPLHGFADAREYYAQSSSGQYLRHIAVPTLILHAKDDPFMAPEVIPAESELSASVRLELSAHGGHVGFVSAGRWGEPAYWLEQRIPAFLREQMQPQDAPETVQYAGV